MTRAAGHAKPHLWRAVGGGWWCAQVGVKHLGWGRTRQSAWADWQYVNSPEWGKP